MNIIRWWDMGRIISLERAYLRRKRYVDELYEMALLLTRRNQQSYESYEVYRLFIRSAYHSVIVWFLHLRGITACRFWLWWNRLWIRRGEFHPSLDCDSILMWWMTPEQTVKYLADLSRRRNIMRERNLACTD